MSTIVIVFENKFEKKDLTIITRLYIRGGLTKTADFLSVLPNLVTTLPPFSLSLSFFLCMI